MVEGKKNYAQRAQVRTLIAELTPREIGEQLGISRQRVYQILDDEGIDYKPFNQQHRLDRRISRNLSRSLGPAFAHVDRNTRGGISELLVAADLMALGWKPYVPLFRNHGHDIIAAKSASLITIEVRSALRRKDGSIAASEYTPGRRANHFAFVLRDEPVIYKPALPLDADNGMLEQRSRGGQPQYANQDIEEAAKRFRAGETLKVIRRDVKSRTGKMITELRLSQRIAQFEERRATEHAERNA